MSGSKAQPKVVFVNRFFYPDHSATAQILSDLTTHLCKERFQVEVICSRLSYSDAAIRFDTEETWNDVAITRVATTGFGRQNIIGRLVDYLSFYLSCFFCVLNRVRSGDILVVKTDPPLLSVPIGLAGRLKGARVLNWLQDLFPEVGAELGIKFATGPVGSFLRAIRNRSLKKADQNIAIGQRMADRLIEQGVDQHRIEIIHNFSDDETVQPEPNGWEDLRAEWGFSEADFIVGYSGNLGRAHDVETILDAAAKLRKQSQIKFLFVGGGHLRSTVEKQAAERSIDSLQFKPYQPRDQLAQSLCVPDLHWVSLKPALEGLIVPSKLYGVASVGRPLVMIGDPDGEIAMLAKEHGFGETVEIGDSDGLANLLVKLSNDPETCGKLGRSARLFIDNHASRAMAFKLWTDLLRPMA